MRLSIPLKDLSEAARVITVILEVLWQRYDIWNRFTEVRAQIPNSNRLPLISLGLFNTGGSLLLPSQFIPRYDADSFCPLLIRIDHFS